MANEDFTTYTEVDAGGDITITSSRVTFTAFDRDVNSYVYDNKGVDHFDGDYEHLLATYSSAATGARIVYIWGLANAIEDLNTTADHHALYIFGTQHRLYLSEMNSGVNTADYYGVAVGVLYYLKVKRDEAVGANGTLYCYIYDDEARTNLLDTTVVTLTENANFRYIYPLSGNNDGATGHEITGYVENLDLQESIVIEADGSSSGSAVAEVNASAIAGVVSSAVGLAVCSIVAVAIILSSGASVGTAEALGNGIAIHQTVGSSVGVGEALGVSGAFALVIGESVGIAVIDGISGTYSGTLAASIGSSVVLGIGLILSDFETISFMSQITLVISEDSIITKEIAGDSRIITLIDEESLI